MANYYDPRKGVYDENQKRLILPEPVVLPPTNNSFYTDFDLEPQFIQIRESNKAALFVDSHSDQEDKNFNPTDVIVGQNDARSAILMRKIKRMSILYWNINYTSPNLNSRNNVLKVFTPALSIFNVDLGIGQYNTPTDIMTQIVARLNAVLAPITFTATQFGVNNTFALISSVPVMFLDDSTAIQYGEPLINFVKTGFTSADPIPVLIANTRTFFSVGPVTLLYTRFIEFRSSTLYEYTKIPYSSSNFGPNRVFLRAYFKPWQTGDTKMESRDERVVSEPTYFTMNPEQNLTTIDIQLYDEFNQPLNVETSFFFAPLNMNLPVGKLLDWQLIFTCQI